MKAKPNSYKYNEIVKTAAIIFNQKGYNGTTIQDIADELGILKGSLYYYIESKEKLFLDVLFVAVNTLQDNLNKSLVNIESLSPKEALKRAIESQIQSFQSCYNETSVFLNEISNLPCEVRKIARPAIKNFENTWLNIIKLGINNGDFRNDIDLKITVFAILGMCNWTHKWFDLEGKHSTTEIAEMYTKIILEGLLTQQ